MVGAGGLREARIRDLADQHVLEAERLLAADRGALLGSDEVAQEEIVQSLLDLFGLSGEPLDRAGPERPTDDRAPL